MADPPSGRAERARRAGADDVVTLTGDVGELAATAASRVLAPGGRLVNLGGASGDTAEFSSSVLRSRSAAVLGYTNNALTAAQRADALAAVLGHACTGALAVDHDVLPLAAAADGWRPTADGTGRRVVLAPGATPA